jgi:hypothetical protein
LRPKNDQVRVILSKSTSPAIADQSLPIHPFLFFNFFLF